MSKPTDPPPSAPVLDYRPNSVLLEAPAWVDQAEILIASGASPDKIGRHFRTNDIACRYFAMSMNRRFAMDHLQLSCIECEKACATYVAVGWHAVMRPGSFWSRASASADYVTYHPICADCFGRWFTSAEAHRKQQERLVPLLFLGMLAAWILAAILQKSAYRGLAVAILAGMGGLFWVAGYVQQGKAKRAVPWAIKQMNRIQGVALVEFSPIFSRDHAPPEEWT